MPLLLREQDVRSLLTMDDLIETMETALSDYSSGRVNQPLRTVLDLSDQQAFYGVMPAYLPASRALGTKLVTVFARNPQRGLPTHLATIVLLDAETGALLALVDGRYITEARTAAVSAVSVRHLARPDASSLAIIGSGVQARSHLEAIGRVRPLSRVRVWSRSPSHVDSFVTEMQPHTDAPIEAASSANDAVRDADIVVLVTAATEPVIRDAWIRDGTHICAVGACRPTQREMDAALVAKGTLYVDSRQGAITEAGDIVLAMKEGVIGASHVRAELGEVTAGTASGRTTVAEVTVFKSLGMAVEDVAAAQLAYTAARKARVGVEVEV